MAVVSVAPVAPQPHLHSSLLVLRVPASSSYVNDPFLNYATHKSFRGFHSRCVVDVATERPVVFGICYYWTVGCEFSTLTVFKLDA